MSPTKRYLQNQLNPSGFVKARGILGQEAPGASYTTLYTCPEGSSAKVYVNVTNGSGGALTYRIALASGGGTPAAKEFVAYDVSLAAVTVAALGPFFVSGDMSTAGEDEIIVYGSSGDLSFTAHGEEYFG